MPVIAVISQKGGAGKTTLAVHLAAAAEQAGLVSLVIDTDPQATASQWATWRKATTPEVIDSAPPMLPAKIEQAKSLGAEVIVIDTPPHADSAATAALESADLILIPCRPSAFDLAAIQTTTRLVRMFRKPAYVVFMAGSPNAPRIYDDARDLVQGFGIEACPVMLADRAAYRHAAAEGKTVMEYEPHGKAADEIAALYSWISEQVNLKTAKRRKRA